jgi:hypothetical protein
MALERVADWLDPDGDVYDEIITLATAIERHTTWSESDVLRVLYRAADEILILRTRARRDALVGKAVD